MVPVVVVDVVVLATGVVEVATTPGPPVGAVLAEDDFPFPRIANQTMIKSMPRIRMMTPAMARIVRTLFF